MIELRHCPGGISPEGYPQGGWMDPERGLASAPQAELILTSPPFNMALKPRNWKQASTGKAHGATAYSDYTDDLDQRIYEDWIEEMILTAALVLDPDVGHLVLDHKPLYRDGRCVLPEMWLVPALERAGFTLRDRLIWQFEIGADIRDGYFARRHGVLLWASLNPRAPFYADPIRVPSKYSKKDKRYNNLGAVPPNVFRINRVHNRDWWRKQSGHPALFPPELVDVIVQGLTKPGDLVLDPFAGIGTVGAVCTWGGRNFIGWEISEEYVRFGRKHMLGSTRDDFRAWWPWLKDQRPSLEDFEP